MKKEIGMDRQWNNMCMGRDLIHLHDISRDGERWEFVQRLTDDKIGECFLVSTHGRIYECATQKICRLYDDRKSGYLVVSLQQCPQGFKNYKVHRLVALGFIKNPDKDTKTLVHHINGRKKDNRAENLLWVSEVEHKLLHIAKKKDELSYYQFIAELRKQQPIKQEDNAISLENWVEVA